MTKMRSVIAAKICTILLGALATLVAAERAHAQSCSITAASGSFGTVNVLSGAAIDSSSTFTVSCTGTRNQTVRLCIEFGPGSSATDNGQRALSNGSLFLDFELYSDSGYSQVWGSWGKVIVAYGTGGVQYDLPLGSSGSASHTFTLYAAILAGQSTRQPATYTWTGSSPGLDYGYSTAACPINGSTATSSGTTWTATVQSNCNVSATNINFGTSGSTISSAISSTGTITAQCTNTTPYSIGLGNGNYANGSQRRMQAASNQFLNYGLYLDSGHSQPWGTTTSAASCTGGANTCYLGTGAGSNRNVTVYGQVPAQTAPAAGIFADTVVVTVTY